MRHKERPDGKNHKNKKIGHSHIMLDGSGQIWILISILRSKRPKTQKPRKSKRLFLIIFG